jgi:hypothetical protein
MSVVGQSTMMRAGPSEGYEWLARIGQLWLK